ncbi:hypothetical protein BG011_000221 [Mortierella polycephala]|uniref:Uncharacterized protein n=1 Tax=Mortierella polycephala TaxID=41804 RepID=A0A9P6PLJ9_9FUNG|nr:hypothetical protein BG011_000221 [Mortierella polycephala]
MSFTYILPEFSSTTNVTLAQEDKQQKLQENILKLGKKDYVNQQTRDAKIDKKARRYIKARDGSGRSTGGRTQKKKGHLNTGLPSIPTSTKNLKRIEADKRKIVHPNRRYSQQVPIRRDSVHIDSSTVKMKQVKAARRQTRSDMMYQGHGSNMPHYEAGYEIEELYAKRGSLRKSTKAAYRRHDDSCGSIDDRRSRRFSKMR